MTTNPLVHIHTFCHSGDCCPQLFRAVTDDPAREFVIKDDHDGSIQLSREDLATLLSTDLADLDI